MKLYLSIIFVLLWGTTAVSFDGTQYVQHTIDSQPSPVIVIVRRGNLDIDFSQLYTGGKAVHFVSWGGSINGVPFSSFWLRTPDNGDVPNMPPAISDGTRIINKYQCISNDDGTPDSKLYGYYFDMRSGGGSEEPVRGVIGNVTNTGVGGAYKAVRVGAIDDGSASALMAFCGSITPNDTTQNAYCQQLDVNGADGKGAFMLLSGSCKLKNGIVFQQGLEVDDAWIQASMTDASGQNARFLKLKDGTGAELFYVDKSGKVNAVTFTAGTISNGVEVTQTGVTRTHPDGNLEISAGSNGELYLSRGKGNAVVKINAENELEVLSSAGITNNGVRYVSGSGSPEGVVSAPVGSIYTNKAGSPVLWVKESGTGVYGWVSK